MTNNQKQNKKWQVVLEKSGLMADFQKFRTEIMSEMLDSPELGLFQTSRFYAKLDNKVKELISQVEQRKDEEWREKIEEKKIKYPDYHRRQDWDLYNQVLDDLLK